VEHELIDDPGAHPVVDADEVGLDHARLARVLDRAARDVEDGTLPSCQLAVACRGRLVATRTIGAPPSGRYLVYSVTKALIAARAWQVLATTDLERTTRVVDLVPAFAEHGKDVVTVEHLLTHTGGFPRAGFDSADWDDPARRADRFASWDLEWEPGSRFEYHGTSAHWVLAHLIEVATREDHRVGLRREVIDPLGLPALQLGTPVPDQGDVRDAVIVGEPRAETTPRSTGVGLDLSAIGGDDADLLRMNDPVVRAVGQPGGGAIGRAADVALFYQGLLDDRQGLFRPDLPAAGTSEILCTATDPMTGAPANRTLGLVLAGGDGHAVMRGFADTTSPRTFGHMGAGGQVAWADPVTGVSFVYFTDGLDRDPFRLGARGLSLSTAVGRAAKPITG
jgi:CubicO group peptidase (beta-lactamase class C family)